MGRRLELPQNGARRACGARDLGDASLFGRCTVFKRNFRGGNFRVAPFAGVELPTGEDDENDSFGRLPAGVPSGSGSWDPFGGANNPNSIGTRLFLVPGLQRVARRWIAEAAVQLPVLQDLNGTTLENDFIARAGFRVNF